MGARFQELFHSPPGVLFTFPSRYWYAIGQTGMLRLTQRSGLIHAGFHEARATWDNTIGRRLTSGTGLAPSTARPSSLFPGKPFYDSRPVRRNRDTRSHNTGNATPDGYHAQPVWSRSAFARHYSRSIPSCRY